MQEGQFRNWNSGTGHGSYEKEDSDDDDEQVDRDTNDIVKEVCMENSSDINKDIQTLTCFVSDAVRERLTEYTSKHFK